MLVLPGPLMRSLGLAGGSVLGLAGGSVLERHPLLRSPGAADRMVECSALKRACEATYASVLPKASKPFIYMSLRLPTTHVDVNMHPTKREVLYFVERIKIRRMPWSRGFSQVKGINHLSLHQVPEGGPAFLAQGLAGDLIGESPEPGGQPGR